MAHVLISLRDLNDCSFYKLWNHCLSIKLNVGKIYPLYVGVNLGEMLSNLTLGMRQNQMKTNGWFEWEGNAEILQHPAN